MGLILNGLNKSSVFPVVVKARLLPLLLCFYCVKVSLFVLLTRTAIWQNSSFPYLPLVIFIAIPARMIVCGFLTTSVFMLRFLGMFLNRIIFFISKWLVNFSKA